jgi:hypothetical protein
VNMVFEFGSFVCCCVCLQRAKPIEAVQPSPGHSNGCSFLFIRVHSSCLNGNNNPSLSFLSEIFSMCRVTGKNPEDFYVE